MKIVLQNSNLVFRGIKTFGKVVFNKVCKADTSVNNITDANANVFSEVIPAGKLVMFKALYPSGNSWFLKHSGYDGLVPNIATSGLYSLGYDAVGFGASISDKVVVSYGDIDDSSLIRETIVTGNIPKYPSVRAVNIPAGTAIHNKTNQLIYIYKEEGSSFYLTIMPNSVNTLLWDAKAICAENAIEDAVLEKISLL